ncbi:Dbl domain-containing protein [Serendipita vermifera]|nr:Dbl domain-containing protein [Serendipita vermifera]
MKGPLGLHADEEEEEEDEELEEDRFVNLALLSHLANRLRDRIPRGTHVKGSIPYPRAFTGKDIVSTIQTLIQKEFQSNMGFVITDRRPALQVARSLQGQLFFYEVEWGGRILQDGLEDVYMFLDDNPASEGSNAEYRHDRVEREELPTGVITLLTKCYAPSCQEGSPCYTYTCPRRTTIRVLTAVQTPWGEMVDKQTLNSLPEAEIRRQTIISKVIMKEQQYVQDLDLIETIFIKELRRVNPPIIAPENLEDFISEVFGNFFELRQCNRRILDVMLVRQREQGPIIQRIGDIFLGAAAEFRSVYPLYVGNLPVAEKRIKEEAENNPAFRRFLEQSSRQDTRGLDMKHFIYRPSEHLQKYPVLLEAIFKETAEGNPDADFLVEAEQAIRNLSTVAQLRTFQSAMGRGPTGKWEWHDLVPKEIRNNVTKQESQRQAIIWELIKGEMVYVKDLETIDTLFIRPLRESEIIPPDRLPAFLQDVFHNFAEIHGHHRRMLERLHEIQREEHPFIRSITAPVFDAALNWRDAYLEYIPHYPIAAFKIDDEMANNPSFKAFIDQCIRHPDSRRLDLKAFINRPIPRLLRYELLLKNILEATPPGNEDHDTIPQVLEVIKDLGKSSEPGVQSAKQKVELWGYHTNLVFKPGEYVDMDLLHETRTLIHAGKLLRQPETGFDLTGGWTDLFVLLFDNYLVFTKPREKDGIVKYHVNRRPIPLDLLTLPSSMEPPILRNTGLLRPRTRTVMSAAGDNNNTLTGLNAGDPVDNRYVYPIHIHHNGRTGGIHTVFAESAQARAEWRMKLEEGLGLRKVVQESNKVFEIETLSIDTFLVPAVGQNMTAPSWNEEGMFTGNVTCSVPFTTPDGRGLVAIGCAEGVWIGLQHDSKSMRRVLHLKLVTQCAMLEDFGIFLVLADKSLFAYHIEALVPSNPPSPHASRTPQKLNGNKDVQFFSVGTMGGRTLIIYMKRRGMDSVFRVLEPVVERITEKAKAPAGFGRFAFGNNRSEWFRVFRDFFLPSEAYDLYFLKAKIAILCSKGFEVMDLTDFKSVTIPQREDPRLAPINRRLETCKPLGMFRSSENEFLLCYTEFGLYVNRHGDPSRQVVVVEWEGTAVRAACHPPYVLLFDSRFIEIRHIETGRLAQIIPGNDVRCLWDGRGGSAPPLLTPGPDGWQEGGAQDARVHASMRLDEIANANMRPGMRGAAQQHVFELLPTIPLYLPGSLASPSQSTYFPQSSSPPHSPRLNPAWRG